MAVHLLPNLISLISRQKAVPDEYFADFHESSPAVVNYWSAVSAIDQGKIPKSSIRRPNDHSWQGSSFPTIRNLFQNIVKLARSTIRHE
jgi:hypothetical protein